MALRAGSAVGFYGADGAALALLAPQLDMLLAAGGGARIWPDPASGRTAWGTTSRPAGHEIWFSSTSAQAISQSAWDANLALLARLTRNAHAQPLSLSAWFDDIRLGIARHFAGAQACVLLAATAAQARLFARAIAMRLLRRRLVEIASTPAESAHFEAGGGADIITLSIDLRHPDGEPRERADIDAEALALGEAALESGAALLLHLLDTSKTGLSGISRGAARAIERAAPGRALTLVDACEGRAYRNEIRGDLEHGRMVLVSGSHFSGGPAFCAALLLPAEMAAELAADNIAPGAAPAGARFDLPPALRGLFASSAAPPANIGLGLRWAAALCELDAYFRIDPDLRRAVLETFSRKARAMAARRVFLTVEAAVPGAGDDPLRESIVTLILNAPAGPRAALDYAGALRAALARPCPGLAGDAICHIGHPILTGERAALSVSASAPMASAVARRMEGGLAFERAMAPVLRDLDTLFCKWEALAGNG